MKKMFKALIGIVLVLSLALSFAACSSDEPVVAPVTEEKSPDEAKAVVEEIMKGVADYDQETIEELDIEWIDVDALYEEFFADMGEEGAIYSSIFDVMFEKYFDSYEYKIGDVEKGDGACTVNVEFPCIDMDDATGILNEVDVDTIGEDIMMDMLSSGEIAEDMGEEEIMAVIMEEMVTVMEAEIEKALEDAATETFDLEFVVEKKDGEWKVNVDESEYEDLREELESIGM